MRLSEQIETGSLPIDPECGHILMAAVLPGIKAMEQALESIGGTANAAIGEAYHDTGEQE